MRQLLLFSTALVVLACEQQPSAPSVQAAKSAPAYAATSEWTEDTTTFVLGDGPYFYCEALGESMEEEGTYIQTYHTVTNGNNATITYKTFVVDYHVVAPHTGNWYPLNKEIAQGTIHTSLQNGVYVFANELKPLYVNGSTGTRLYFPEKDKVTINSNGTVLVDRTRSPCKLIGN